MDVKQYISSGILELYVLGALDDQQVAEVERYAVEHPAIRKEISEIEVALEAFADAKGRPANPAVLSALLEDISQGKRPPTNTGGPGAAGATPAPPARPRTENEKATRGGGGNWMGWLAAGIIALIAAFLYFGAQTTAAELSEELSTTQTEFNALQEDCDATNTALTRAEQQLQVVSNPATQVVILAGTENAPDSRAIVFYNQTLDQTLFRASELPTPPAGKQYQLWGIDGDGPKSLGVLDLDLEGTTVLEVPYISGVGTFAITLEDTGGKPTPDLTQLQVAGATS